MLDVLNIQSKQVRIKVVSAHIVLAYTSNTHKRLGLQYKWWYSTITMTFTMVKLTLRGQRSRTSKWPTYPFSSLWLFLWVLFLLVAGTLLQTTRQKEKKYLNLLRFQTLFYTDFKKSQLNKLQFDYYLFPTLIQLHVFNLLKLTTCMVYHVCTRLVIHYLFFLQHYLSHDNIQCVFHCNKTETSLFTWSFSLWPLYLASHLKIHVLYMIL